MYICEECGEQIRDFMIESYEMFVDVEENIEEYLCAGCLQEVTGEEID
jgi:DNA-directed RNA polymerase subunit RPC12/RpoP